MKLRAELARLVDGLIRGTAPGDAIELDAIGEAIGARAVGQDEIDGIIAAIEAKGRRVTTPKGGHGEASLRRVIEAARVLRQEGRTPRADEIAERAGMTVAEVQHALALVRIMQR